MPVADDVDVAIIGGGILGLATAYLLLEARPRLRVTLLEKERALATHQSGHNSGVVHAGIYYAPGSLKATLCREGKAKVERFAGEHGIALRRPGKLVVALDPDEAPRLEALRERATANGVEGLEILGPERIRELEPHVVGSRALWSPTTGIIDFRAVALACAAEARTRGADIQLDRAVTSIDERSAEVILGTSQGELQATNVIACAGLQADRVAALSGDRGPDVPRIVPFRGDYYTLTPDARHLVSRLIYPLPDPRFPFLGVHFTPRIDGEVWAGPNAVLAFAREGYRRRDLNLRDLGSTLAYRGFQRLALRYLRTGLAEMRRDWSKGAFLHELRRYVPELRGEQIVFGPSGVRAQALDREGRLVDDFSLGGSRRVLHVRNAPSPAATASLAIGRVLVETATERFGLA
jgi:(S)-2-hydroxyglutarate dehydrogenase